MILSIDGNPTEVEYIRVHRDANGAAFHALVNDEWVFFYKFRDKRIPFYHQFEWPNPEHMYGWSNPYRIQE